VRPCVGISACLLGERVRFDGGHKRDDFLTDVLGRRVDWVPVCPEVEIGLGTPREPLHLVRLADTSHPIHLMTTGTALDHSSRMREWAARRLDELEQQKLSGYVLKSKSPSCGMDVKVFDAAGAADGTAPGVFADALISRFPDLPVEEESRLADAAVRDRFVERVFAYHRQHG
jgi:uncharacterized protein YbbK (DUF523 family)